jgi:hypothetical protein
MKVGTIFTANLFRKRWALSLAIACQLGVHAANAPAIGAEAGSASPAAPQLHTATTHPMKFYIAGFSASTHIAYMFLFAHPELLKGVVINSGVYLGRGVDEDHIPLLNSPERANLAIKYIIGENDPGYKECTENWLKTRAKLLCYGHPASKMQMEVIKKANPENLHSGHNWYPTRIVGFCTAAEAAVQQ